MPCLATHKMAPRRQGAPPWTSPAAMETPRSRTSTQHSELILPFSVPPCLTRLTSNSLLDTHTHRTHADTLCSRQRATQSSPLTDYRRKGSSNDNKTISRTRVHHNHSTLSVVFCHSVVVSVSVSVMDSVCRVLLPV